MILILFVIMNVQIFAIVFVTVGIFVDCSKFGHVIYYRKRIIRSS